jgi:diguanylate cyclase (GGDEF)-like protein
MHRFSLKTRLIVILAIVLFLAFFVTSVVNYRISKQAVHEEILTSTLPLTTDTIYSEIQSDLIRPTYVSSLMANDTFLKDWTTDGEQDLDKIVRYLREIRDRYGFFTSFFVSAKSRNYYYYDGVLKKISPEDAHDVWFYNFIQSGRDVDLDVDTNQAADNVLTIFINHRVRDADGELLGVTGVGLKMDMVAQMVRSYQERYKRNIFFVDRAGVIQVHADRNMVEAHTLADLPGVSGIAREITEVRAVSRDLGYAHDGRDYLLTARYIPEFDWILVVEQNETLALATARRNLVHTVAVGFVASILVIAVCIFTVNAFQGRLEILAATDFLTGVANRREFEQRFARALIRREARHGELTLILLDIDDFKLLNDRLGHLEGDRVLKDVAAKALSVIRKDDVLARWGGDEFIILTESDTAQAAAVAERLRQAVAETSVSAPGEPEATPLGISCGLAAYRAGDTLDSLIQRADEAMYGAKREKSA